MRSALALALTLAASIQPTRGTVGLVRVDVIVADARGRTVEDLGPGDFDIREDGTPQTIETVRFIKVGGQPASAGTLPPIRTESDEWEQAADSEARLLAIFLDEYHVRAGEPAARVRQSLARFIDDQIGPRDLVTVMRPLDSLRTIRLTRDRAVLRQAVEAFEGRQGDYAPRSAFEEQYVGRAPSVVERWRTQVTISALNALSAHVGALREGRKALVLVSEGFVRAAPARGAELLPDLRSLVRAATRFNVAIYPVDPGGLAGPVQVGAVAAAGADTLRALAEDTNGQAIGDPDLLQAGMQAVLADSSAYYLITYRPSRSDDGRFHGIQISVKRSGVHVRARKGYWAPSPDEALPAPSPTGPTASAADPPTRHISPLISPWFGIARGEGGKTRVTFVWEPARRVSGERPAPSPPSRVTLQAIGSDGTPVFEGTVRPAGPVGLPGDDTAPARAVFDLPPGRLELRMSIHDAGARLLDKDVREISIRDLSAPVALGTPGVLRARTAREYRALDADPDAVPVAAREFSRTERLIIRVHAYAPGGSPTVSARLLNRLGRAMRELPVKGPASADGPHQIDLPLAGLAAGDYFVEVAATSPAGDAKDLLTFRVTG